MAPAPTSAPDAAENLRRYTRLVERTIDVFGDEIRANLWLSSPSPDFGGKAPLQVAQEASYDLASLEPVLVRLEHGIDF